ncbi:hypothetical protein, partial [Chryseobacterium taklimakanense]|uniref:hypothetical protein n=1 Tax=Chryseobacterium taklimakanense TaxID=536441 RepID=UPI0023F9D652
MPKNERVTTSVSQKDTVIAANEQLRDIVEFTSDFQRTDPPKKMTYLNKNAVVTYQDMKIMADYISIDW